MTQEQIKTIKEQEQNLKNASDFLEKATALLEEWKSLQPKIQSLEAYYHSPKWQEDYEMSNQTPPDFPHGVLSEDAVYLFLANQQQTAIDYIKLMANILDNKPSK